MSKCPLCLRSFEEDPAYHGHLEDTHHYPCRPATGGRIDHVRAAAFVATVGIVAGLELVVR